jgi:hypothetical protein
MPVINNERKRMVHMAGFTYRRVDPDRKEATLIRDLLVAHVGEKVKEMAADPAQFAEMYELLGIQKRWTDLAEDLKVRPSAYQDGPLHAADSLTPAEVAARRTRKGGAAAAENPTT